MYPATAKKTAVIRVTPFHSDGMARKSAMPDGDPKPKHWQKVNVYVSDLAWLRKLVSKYPARIKYFPEPAPARKHARKYTRTLERQERLRLRPPPLIG